MKLPGYGKAKVLLEVKYGTEQHSIYRGHKQIQVCMGNEKQFEHQIIPGMPSGILTHIINGLSSQEGKS